MINTIPMQSNLNLLSSNNIIFNKIISITKYQRNYIKTTLDELAKKILKIPIYYVNI